MPFCKQSGTFMDYLDDEERIQWLWNSLPDYFEKYTDLTFTGCSISFDGEHYRVNFKVLRGASECLVCYFEVNEVYDAFQMMYTSFISNSFQPVWKKDRFAQERLDKKRENN